MLRHTFRSPPWSHLALLLAVWVMTIPVVARAAAKAPPAPLTVQGVGKSHVSLDGAWQFHLGDDPAWASPTLDDSGWEQLGADQTWGSQTHFNYVGFAWYRRHLELAPTSGGDADLSLLVPTIDDVYEVYWNGKRIGGLGKFPPHPYWYVNLPPQVYGLGKPNDGVLAFRVWMAPPVSSDSGQGGGFNRPPMIGAATSLAEYLDASVYRRFHRLGFGFVINGIYALLGLLGLLGWLRNRDRPLLLWMSIWSLALLFTVLLNFLQLHVPQSVTNSIMQVTLSLADISIWYLLLYLLELDRRPYLRRCTFILACISMFCGVSDALLMSFDWSGPHVAILQIADAVLTLPTMLIEVFPLVLIGFAFGKRLDAARWLVAILAALAQLTIAFQNLTAQGQRFTHWTLSSTISAPLFILGGYPFSVQAFVFLFLLVGIIFAVYRYTAEQSKRQSALEQEFRSAQELQQVLIPENLPSLEGYSTTSAYRPAQQVGGDFFQLIARPDGSALLVLGDVSGKGLKAAMTVSLIVGTIRTAADISDDPAEMLAILNRRLCGRLGAGFVTCVALRLDSEGGCVLANAGHPAPFLNDHELDLPGALPLGLDAQAAYDKISISLAVGDRLTLYTDGLLEARNAIGEIYSFDRLQALIRTRPDARTATDAAVAFGQDDDITVITLTRLAPGEQATTSLMSPELVTA